tara:strand:+ start:572 stop:1204 length:633 start_codon:yes stop_codon:yes gene_type:complete
MINTAEIFPTLIASQMINIPDGDVTHLINKALELQHKNEVSNNVKGWQCNTFSSLDSYIPQDDNDEKLLNVVNTTRELVHEFSLLFGCGNKKEVYKEEWYKKVYCVDAWFNVANSKDYQEYHYHPNSHISAVFYLTVPKNSGDIVFRNPTLNMFPIPSDSNGCLYNAETYTVPIQEKLLILFKSNLHHMVQQNMSANQRISIAMNFRVER